MVWGRMEQEGIARFPGARGRIPNFPGAEGAASLAATLPAWKEARTLKINPDSPQRALRRLALEEGKVLYMAVPRLREERCFFELDPRRLRATAHDASSIRGAAEFGRPVRVDEVPSIDLVVCGSVAVSRDGRRLGKGGGYSDLEYALLAERGRIGPATGILTTVHPIQIVEGEIEMKVHDIPLDFIVTPGEIVRVAHRRPRPKGIYWELLPEEKIEAIPVLQGARRGGRR